MKTHLTLVLVVFLYTVSFANDSFKNIVLVSSENKNITLDYFGFESIETSLIIKDRSNIVLFNETAKKPDLLQQKFSLNELNGDMFIIRIENKYKSIEATYKYDGETAMAQGHPNEIFKPIFIKKEKEVLLYVLNSLQRKVVIDIVDEYGNTLVSKIVSSKSVIKKLFDFSSFTSKAKIRVSNGEYFVQEFNF
ncbi:hypothetical protein [Aquimarina mytili]|uniref:Secretion system C-terminal sorting domain-containing protein n=1 Tax=Aquimarina mytili TaxID=874423 RepID=A0A936ZVQ5_9FLAO|nr:hypothetical protein [Aquimarina mytili]MBL0685548.1 hypothetical protein [Aquimarina mytili]